MHLTDKHSTHLLQVPADMVVNSIIASMAAHSGDHQCCEIYQIGSSMKNPLVYSRLKDFGFWYFTEHPWIDKEGNPVIVGDVTVLNTMDSFRRYMALRYIVPLKVNIFDLQLYIYIY